MPFPCNKVKNGLIYALIGLFLTGGLCLVSAKVAKASTDFTTISLPVTYGGVTYTHYIKTKWNNGSDNWGVELFNDNADTFGGSGDAGTYGGHPVSFIGTVNYVGTDYNIPSERMWNIDVISGYTHSDVFIGCTGGFDNCSDSGNADAHHFLPACTDSGLISYESDLPLNDNNGGSCTYTPVTPYGSTRFITVTPENGTTTATTSPIGARIFFNAADLIGAAWGQIHIHAYQDSAFACMNSGAVFDAVVTCAGSNAPVGPFNYDFATSTLTKIITGGDFSFLNTITWPGGGKWNVEYDIQQVSQPWYCPLGICHTYTTIVSTTTQIVIGQLSPMDVVRNAVASTTAAINRITQQGIGAILASTTASVKNACQPFSSGFNIGDCITLLIYPGDQAMNDNFTIIKQLPPWGYAFRVYDLLSATSSTTTMPTIDYTFATSSPMSVMGNIHFDPFGSIAEAGSLINDMKSDRADPQNVWQILMPVVNVFIYLVLGFMIIHDLTGIHKHGDTTPKHKDRDKNL